jgi:hypothetical protein
MVTFAGHICKFSSKPRYTMQKNNYKRKLSYTLIAIVSLLLLAISSPAMATDPFLKDALGLYEGIEAESMTSTSADKTPSSEEIAQIAQFVQAGKGVIEKHAALSESLMRTQEELRKTKTKSQIDKDSLVAYSFNDTEQKAMIKKQEDQIASLERAIKQNEILKNEYKTLNAFVFNIFCLTCVIALFNLARVALLARNTEPKNAINQRAIVKQQ